MDVGQGGRSRATAAQHALGGWHGAAATVLMQTGALPWIRWPVSTWTVPATGYVGITCHLPGESSRGSSRVIAAWGAGLPAMLLAKVIACAAAGESVLTWQPGTTSTSLARIPSAASFAFAPWIAAILWSLTVTVPSALRLTANADGLLAALSTSTDATPARARPTVVPASTRGRARAV